MSDIWDLYDKSLNITNKTIKKGETIPTGYYHLSVEIWIMNSKNEVLLLRNNWDYKKIYPGIWRCLTGNLNTKENVNDCIIRLMKEKIGVDFDLKDLTVLGPHLKEKYNYAYFTCIIKKNILIDSLNINNNIYMDAKYVNKEELLKMCNNGEIAYYLVSRIKEEVLKYF